MCLCSVQFGFDQTHGFVQLFSFYLLTFQNEMIDWRKFRDTNKIQRDQRCDFHLPDTPDSVNNKNIVIYIANMRSCVPICRLRPANKQTKKKNDG